MAETRSSGPLPPEYVTAEDIAEILRISIRTVYRLRARGDLPQPIEVSKNIVRWLSSDIREYLAGLKPRTPRRRG